MFGPCAIVELKRTTVELPAEALGTLNILIHSLTVKISMVLMWYCGTASDTGTTVDSLALWLAQSSNWLEAGNQNEQPLRYGRGMAGITRKNGMTPLAVNLRATGRRFSYASW